MEGFPPKIFLERLGEKSGELYPMPGYLKSGMQTVRMQVSAGDYELGVLPMGLLDLSSARLEPIRVIAGDKNHYTLNLAGRRQKTIIELSGLSGRDFPVTVYPQPLDQSVDMRVDDGALLASSLLTKKARHGRPVLIV